MKLVLRPQWLLVVFSLLISNKAFCTLGEKADMTTQSTTQKKMSQQTAGYTVQESDVNGTTVREYILPNGTVFAVTWRGIKHPDLTSVLGTYNSEFEKLKSQKAKAVGRVPVSVKSNRVSVRMSGHMRDVHGQAYDPNLLPEQFSLSDLK